MKASDHQPLVRVESLLRCWGSSVESISLVISDSPMLLSLLEQNSGADDFMPLELYSELTFEPSSIELHGYFNRAPGYRLQGMLKESIGNQWHWLPPRRYRTPWCRSGGAGRTIIPVQRLWFSWEGAETHPASEQDFKTSATKLPPVDGTQGFCNDKLLVMPVERSLVGVTDAGAQQELLRLVAYHSVRPRKGAFLAIESPIG